MTPPPVELPSGSPPAPTRAPERPWARVDTAALAGYCGVAGLKLAAHPMWRDELQSWELARTSRTLPHLLGRVRYEQHPPVWYVLLWGWSRLSGNPRMLQALAFLLVAATAVVVLRWAPWPRPLRWLLLGGYYPLFEWSTLARPYLLTFLLALIGAELVRRRRLGAPLAAVLAGLVLTDDAYGSVVAAALLTAALAGSSRWVHGSTAAAREGTAGRRGRRLSVVGLGAAVVAAGISDLPPHDYGGPTLGLSGHSVLAALEAPAHALVPLPDLTTEFWTTSLIDAAGAVVVVTAGAAGSVAVARALRGDRRAWWLWAIGVAGTVAVQSLTDLPYARFIGTIVVVLVSAFWVHAELPSAAHRRLLTALAVALGLQVPGALVAIAESGVHPFSQSAAAAEAIRDLPGTVIAVRDEAGVPVAAYAGRPLDLADGQPAPTDFITWDQARLCAGRRCNTTQLLEEALYEAQEGAAIGPVYVLTDFPVPPGTVSLVPLGAWTGAVVNEEDYWLYIYEP